MRIGTNAKCQPVLVLALWLTARFSGGGLSPEILLFESKKPEWRHNNVQSFNDSKKRKRPRTFSNKTRRSRNDRQFEPGARPDTILSELFESLLHLNPERVISFPDLLQISLFFFVKNQQETLQFRETERLPLQTEHKLRATSCK